MQTANFRFAVLTTALLVGVGMNVVFGQPTEALTLRWPDKDAVYAVDSWSVGPEAVEVSSNNTNLVTRVFRNSGGVTATLTIVAQQVPKLYGAGAEVPFLGSGYAITLAPDDVTNLEGDGVSSLVAQRGTERWLVMYAYGERRGLLGNGALPWTLAFLDGIVGRPNDYYKLYLAARTDRVNGGSERDIAQLAHTVFPRVATWYSV